MKVCCSKQILRDNGKYKYCKTCGTVQKEEPVFTPTGFHACPKCKGPTVTQGQYCSVACATISDEQV